MIDLDTKKGKLVLLVQTGILVEKSSWPPDQNAARLDAVMSIERMSKVLALTEESIPDDVEIAATDLIHYWYGGKESPAWFKDC